MTSASAHVACVPPHGEMREMCFDREMLRLLLLPLILVSSPALAETRPNLCQAGEIPAFSCATGGKIVSLCVSRDLSDTEGTLTYRFGTKRKIEMVWPRDGVRPQEAFRGGVSGYSGGGADYLRFHADDAIYTLYSDYYRGRESDGVTVERGGKRIAVLKCRGGAVDPREGWSRIYKAKLPRNTEDFDVPGVND